MLVLVVARRLLEADGTEKEGSLSLRAWLLPLYLMGLFYVPVRGLNGVLRQGLPLWHISDGSFDGLYHWNERELSFWLAAGGEKSSL